MSSKAEIIEKLRRLAAPDSGATDGERKAALAAIERISGSADDQLSDVDLDDIDWAKINDKISESFNKMADAMSYFASIFNSR